MKLCYLTLAAIIFTALFTTGMQCENMEEQRRLRRNERRSERKLKRGDRSKRLRNHRKERQTPKLETLGMFSSDAIEITPALPPVQSHPENPLELKDKILSKLHEQMHQQHNEQEESVTATSNINTDRHSEEAQITRTNHSNIWSDNHDILAFNVSTLNTTAMNNLSLSNTSDFLENGTVLENITTTERPISRTTPDAKRVEIWRNQKRNRMLRIMMIQNEILTRLGIQKHPNISANERLTPEARKQFGEFLNRRITDSSSRDLYDNEDYFAKRYHWHLPSCETPKRADMSWYSSEMYRLYFDRITINKKRAHEDTKVSSATLNIYKKAFQGCECELRRKDDTESQPVDSRQARRRRQMRGTGTLIEQVQVDNDSDDSEEDEEEPEAIDLISVSLYKYIKPVKTNKRKKKKVPTATLR